MVLFQQTPVIDNFLFDLFDLFDKANVEIVAVQKNKRSKILDGWVAYVCLSSLNIYRADIWYNYVDKLGSIQKWREVLRLAFIGDSCTDFYTFRDQLKIDPL